MNPHPPVTITLFMILNYLIVNVYAINILTFMKLKNNFFNFLFIFMYVLELICVFSFTFCV